MGGLGSGRADYATTPTVENCRELDVNEFTDAVEYPGMSTTVQWGSKEDPSGSIRVYLLPQNKNVKKATSFRLEYTITDGRTGEKTTRDYRVPLEYTECNFGGERPWFRCPGVVSGERCNRRVAKLYRPPRGELFFCCHCYDLGYTSSRTSGNELKQAELRYRRAFAKADKESRRPHPNNRPWLPERPKGMHSDTYEEFLDKVQAARREWASAMQKREQQLLQGLEDV